MRQFEVEMDMLGRIVIPVEMRKELGIELRSELAITVDDTSIVLTPNASVCKLCGATIQSDSKQGVCSKCTEAIKADKPLDHNVNNRMIVRKIDELGRVVLPKEYRNMLGLGEIALVDVVTNNGSIFVTPESRVCRKCGAVISINKKYCLCEHCLALIKSNTIVEEVAE